MVTRHVSGRKELVRHCRGTDGKEGWRESYMWRAGEEAVGSSGRVMTAAHTPAAGKTPSLCGWRRARASACGRRPRGMRGR